MIKKGNKNVDYIAITDANNNVDYPVKVWFANANNTLKLIYERPTYDIHIINLSINTKLGNANKVTNIIFTNNLNLRNQAYNNNIVNVTYQNNIPTFEFLVQNQDNQTFTCYVANAFYSPNKKVICHGNFRECFAECTILTTINISQFDTTNITHLSLFFDNCNKLATLDLSNFVTTNVTSFVAMFRNCKSLTNLDLSNFTTTNVTSYNYMFSNCVKLIRLDLSTFNTTNATSFYCMFQNVESLRFLKINFNTSNCSTMFGMFQQLRNIISLDISTFNTANVTDMYQMFTNCNKLQRLFSFSFNKTKLQTDDSMFENLYNIKGEHGTTYLPEHIDSEYARIDGENGLPGYFCDPADAITLTLINVDNEQFTDELYFLSGDTYTIPNLEGYTATVTDNNGNTYTDGDIITINQDVTLNFVWTATS